MGPCSCNFILNIASDHFLFVPPIFSSQDNEILSSKMGHLVMNVSKLDCAEWPINLVFVPGSETEC